MVMEVRVQFDVSRVQSLFQRLPENIRKQVGKGMYDIARSYQRSLRYSLNRNSKRFDWKIYDGIQARKISDNQSVVVIPLEGKYLDDMRPHFVSLKKGRRITAWAKQYSNLDEIRKRQGSIYVRPHPFIAYGLIRGREGRQRIMDNAMTLAMNSSKK